MNHQKIEKAVDSELLDVVKVFLTIQGEGPLSGVKSVFIRLGGCTLQCKMCDTDYTSGRHLMSVEAVVLEVEKYDCRTVVLTGGEPFRQKLSMKLIEALSSKGITCQVETSGSCWFDDWKSVPEHCIIVCSPKTGKVVSGIIPWIDYYKYIVSWDGIGKDGLPIVSPITGQPVKLFRPVANRTGKIPDIYVSPWDVKDAEINRKNQEAATCSCFNHDYRLSLQIHKLIGVE